MNDPHIARAPSIFRWFARGMRQQLYPIPHLSANFVRRAGELFSDEIRASAVCLDIGSGVSPHRSIAEQSFDIAQYIALDIAPSEFTNLVADATQLPFADSYIDIAISIETLQHIANVNAALDEIVRVLAPGGIVIIGVPFVFAECDLVDFRRWTLQGIKFELESRGFEILLARRRGGLFFAVASMLHWGAQHIIPGARLSWRTKPSTVATLRAAIVLILALPTAGLSWLALGVDALLPESGLYAGTLVVARHRQVKE